MFENLLRQLTIWRNETAKREGVDGFRVLPNRVLEEIARVAPKDKQGMVAIKGIKEAKFAKYGREILRIVKAEDGTRARPRAEELNYFRQLSALHKGKMGEGRGEALLIGDYLDRLNDQLAGAGARIRGEVSSLDKREKVVYFSLKDKQGESVINCLIFRYQFDTLGVELKEGMEVIAEGHPEIYKPYGRLSFKAEVIELFGEGELKREYEKLKQKLTAEGYFDESGKRQLKGLPQRIGLITSREGAAIGDFMSNLGQFGLQIKFVNSSVEGKRAVFELLRAVRTLARADIDVLVIIRGGGSLESLQAFNNEALVREVKRIGVPVVCGVGHERDVSLLALAADIAVSTPTAAARLIGGLWEKEIEGIDYLAQDIVGSFLAGLNRNGGRLRNTTRGIEDGFRSVMRTAEIRCDRFRNQSLSAMAEGMAEGKQRVEEGWRSLDYGLSKTILRTDNVLSGAESVIRLNDPARQLRLGYGIISHQGKSVRSVGELQPGDLVRIRMQDGEAEAGIKSIKKSKL